MIKVQNLSKSFGQVKAVDHISFSVEEGENFVLLGTSGSGKTTTLKMINRLLSPEGGNIFFDGKDISELPPEQLRQNIGYVLQNNGLFPHYTVAQNIAIVPQLLGWDKKRIERRTSILLEKLHLSPRYLNVFPSELSGGQQQRVGLARGLAADPPLLLMDEPFGSLDNVTRTKIHEEFRALDEFKKKTIMMVTHDIQEAFDLGDHICLMDQGKIIQDGKPTELLFNASGAFVNNFLKGQRLQLEFKATMLNDIWEFLPSGENGQGGALPAAMDLWTCMETLIAARTDSLNIRHEPDLKIKSIRFPELMRAFYQYKKGAQR